MDPFHVLREQLAPDVYDAFRQVFTTMGERVQGAEQQAQAAQQSAQGAHEQLLTQQELRQVLTDALSSAQLTVQTNPSTAPNRGTLRVAVQRYDGDYKSINGNVNHWITSFIDAVTASSVHPDLWIPTAAAHFEGLALSWYYGLTQRKQVPATWTEFVELLRRQFDNPVILDQVRAEMINLTYRGDMSTYVNTYQLLEARLPEDKMAYDDRRWNFLSSLPQEARMFILEAMRSKTNPNMSDVYNFALEWAQTHQLAHQSSRLSYSTHPQHNRRDHGMRNKPRRDTPFPHIAPPFSQTNANHAGPSATDHGGNNGPTPMDLDAMQQASVRCYNCNERGHIARNCNRPRRPSNPLANGQGSGQRAYERRPFGMPRQQQMHNFENEGPMLARPSTPFETVNPADVMPPPPKLEPVDEDVPDFSNFKFDDNTDDEYQHLFGAYVNPNGPLDLNVHEGTTTNPTYTVGLGPANTDLQGRRTIAVKALLDTGATSNYVRRDIARRANAIFFPITPREVVGAGKTTTSSFARMTLTLDGRVREDFHAYVLEETSGFRHDVLLGREWMRLHQANIEWKTNKCVLTDPTSGLRYKIKSDTPPPSPTAPKRHYAAPAAPRTMVAAVAEAPGSVPAECFLDKPGYPPARKWEHEIDTGDSKPVRAHGRPLSPVEQSAIKAFIEDALKDGVIEPSSSPYSSPLLPVRKKTGGRSILHLS
ncbi:hypothetical protein BC629DRAFT_66813 [Irpex lacteus]|nr:hypothetical protein BC629DRAFT_66813 [Irpex lacteus]